VAAAPDLSLKGLDQTKSAFGRFFCLERGMAPPDLAKLVESLDDELMDLLSGRLKLASMLRVPSTQEETGRQVRRMRGLAAAYHLPPELGEKVAHLLIEASRLQR